MTFRVLVVDDSKLARMAVAKVLGGLCPDWTRVEAANADEAIAALEEQKPDLVVVDFNMPGRDGLDLAAHLEPLKPTIAATQRGNGDRMNSIFSDHPDQVF